MKAKKMDEWETILHIDGKYRKVKFKTPSGANYKQIIDARNNKIEKIRKQNPQAKIKFSGPIASPT